VTEPQPPGDPKPPGERTGELARRAARAAVGAAWEDLSDTGRQLVTTGRFAARSAWDRRPSRATVTARLFVVAVAVAGAASLLAQSDLAGRLPGPLDWRGAAALLERDGRPGDAVVIAPAWAERARAELPAGYPVLALPGYADEPLVGVRRAWLLALPGAPLASSRIARDLAGRAAGPPQESRLGALSVSLVELAEPARALAWLPDRLASAEARAGVADCVREGTRALRCGPGALRVAREVREVGGLPRPCLTAPAGAGTSGALAITFPGVPMGLELRGGAGLAGRVREPASPAPVRLAVQVDGREVAALELPGAGGGWQRFTARTGPLAGERHAITFLLSSPEPGGRTVCFDGWTVP
jgi:hypothetical protein